MKGERAKMMADAFQRIFIGLLLVLLDFRLQYVDILPDFIGYILVFRALGTLAGQHSYFLKARPFTLTLIFLSLTSLVVTPGMNLLEDPPSSQDLGWSLLGQVLIVLDLFMLYWLCKGIGELAMQRELKQLQEKAEYRWKFYFLATAVMLVYTPFSINVEPAFNLVMFPLVILLFSAMILLLGLVRMARKELVDEG
ncbi:hypothetical protein [Ammoniphilus sp. YIM 78166]|uniref:hypothetical protein n=1 Tax=Ammoniphilus sp. YIM 78166 TaxID=1644106 RepID=UPI00143093EE|nr:hypothetical protein [Ammoniphilus sp. YIM 78166]